MIRKFIIVIGILLLIAAGFGGSVWYVQNLNLAGIGIYQTPEEADIYVRFAMEAYDSIRENFWQKAPEADFANLFLLSASKAANMPDLRLATTTRAGVVTMLAEAFATSTPEAKKQTTLNTLIIALANLPPAERSGLLSSKQETALRNQVANVNPDSDLYSELGLAAGASVAEVEAAYEKKKEEIVGSDAPDKEEKLSRLSYVGGVLSKETSKAMYDENKAEPTVYTKKIGAKTLYVTIHQVSPTTLQEFASLVGSAVTESSLLYLIIDMRSNIGGSLDFGAYFLGMFLGPRQYAFDLFHQEEYKPERTPDTIPRIEELSRFSDIAILTDDKTQSTAEVTTAAMKRLKLAHVVGTKTRGWGSVENTFPLKTSIDPNETYSILLVHSITLRDDQQPIEGRGVDPDVHTEETGWQKKLTRFFPAEMARAIEIALKTPPLSQ